MGRNQRKKVNQKRKKRRIFPSLFLCACQRAVNRCADCRTANTRRQCDFTFFFLPRKQLCCDFTGGHRNSPNSGTLLSAAQTFPLSGESPAPTKVVKTNIKVFARLFQKAAQSKGSAFGRPAHRAKSFFARKRRRGGKTVRWTVLPWGTLAGGSPNRAYSAILSIFLCPETVLYNP